MGQRRTHRSADRAGRDVLDSAADLEGRDPPQVDRPQLVDEDQPVLGLAGMPVGDWDLAWVLGGRVVIGQTVASPDRWNGSYDTTSARRRPCCSCPTVGSKLDDDDGPAQRGSSHAGQRSGSSNAAASCVASVANSGSSAASASVSLRSHPGPHDPAPRPHDRRPRPATSHSGRRARGHDLPSRVGGCTCASSLLPCTYVRRVRLTCQGRGNVSRRGPAGRSPARPRARASGASSARPPGAENPVSAPFAATTRWHGTMIGNGLRASAAPTSRAPSGRPIARATSP